MTRGLPGVVVTRVVAGGPAAKANLRNNDVITRVNGQTIYDKDALRLHISKLPPGSSVNLTVERQPDSRPIERRVVLRKLPLELPQTFTRLPPSWRGATIDWRVPRRSAPGHFPIATPDDDFITPCVAVSAVEEGSLAWRAGLRPGQFISQVAATPVGTPEEFNKAVSSQAGSVKLRLYSPDDGSQQAITVAAE
jgi:serine protease Do